MLELAQLRGRPVLVVFLATTCASCIEEMPHLVELYRELNPKGLEIIGVAMGYDLPEQVQNLVKQQKIPFPIMLDIQENIALKFNNIQLTPTSVLISPDGRIISYLVGPLDMSKLRDRIQAML
jgi:thiol-disulfide isomerase/thioredoxin